MYEPRSPPASPAPPASPDFEPPPTPDLALSIDGDRDPNDDDKGPPPQLIKELRHNLRTGSAYVYTGIRLNTTGYGTAEVSTELVLVCKNEWISLGINQIGTLFAALRKFEAFEYIGYSSFVDKSGDFYLGGRCDVEKCGEGLTNIAFTDGEHNQTHINGVGDADIIRLLELEAVLDGRLYRLKLKLNDVCGYVDNAVEKYRHNAAEIKEDSRRWCCDSVVVQLAWNLFDTFTLLVHEFCVKNKDNTAFF